MLVIGNSKFPEVLISYMYLMALVLQTHECTTILMISSFWVRDKNKDSLFPWIALSGSITSSAFWLSTWPPVYGMLKKSLLKILKY